MTVLAADTISTLASHRPTANELWALVLAGGEGVRLRPLTRLICGDDRPKQYVTLTGTRTLLQQTLDRAGRAIPAERTVVIGTETHAGYLAAAMAGHGATVLLQPVDRGTAAGVLLPVHWIRNRAPEAVVAVFPSDHLVLEEDAFMDQVTRAAAFVDEHPDRILLLGVRATEAETEYGWIEPGPLLGHAGTAPVHAVRRFIEKPSLDEARACLAAGASWNTFVFVAKAAALVEAGRQRLPDLHAGLVRLVQAARRGARPEALRRASVALPRANFSRDVLEGLAGMLAVTTLTGVTWSDWGSPRRVIGSLERLGLRPPWLDRLTEPIGSAAAG
jgi:mannose-1-phosphate guanylyltransferase